MMAIFPNVVSLRSARGKEEVDESVKYKEYSFLYSKKKLL